MNRDLKANVAVVHTLPPAARTNGTSTGNAVSCLEAQSAMALFHAGDWTDGTHTPSLWESVDGVVAYTQVAAGDLDGTFTPVTGVGQENAVQRVGYKGSAGFLQGRVIVSGATTGALSAMSIAKGHPYNRPVA